MAYQRLRGKSIDEYSNIFDEVYCKSAIVTFDGILVKFYSKMFDHAFFESHNKKEKDKSLFSYNRAEKIMWIKDALEDPTAILKQGWLRDKKTYANSRRVAIVKNNYVVIIRIYKKGKARFVTAFEAYNSIDKILNSPDWV